MCCFYFDFLFFWKVQTRKISQLWELNEKPKQITQTWYISSFGIKVSYIVSSFFTPVHLEITPGPQVSYRVHCPVRNAFLWCVNTNGANKETILRLLIWYVKSLHSVKLHEYIRSPAKVFLRNIKIQSPPLGDYYHMQYTLKMCENSVHKVRSKDHQIKFLTKKKKCFPKYEAQRTPKSLCSTVTTFSRGFWLEIKKKKNFPFLPVRLLWRKPNLRVYIKSTHASFNFHIYYLSRETFNLHT